MKVILNTQNNSSHRPTPFSARNVCRNQIDNLKENCEQCKIRFNEGVSGYTGEALGLK